MIDSENGPGMGKQCVSNIIIKIITQTPHIWPFSSNIIKWLNVSPIKFFILNFKQT